MRVNGVTQPCNHVEHGLPTDIFRVLIFMLRVYKLSVLVAA